MSTVTPGAIRALDLLTLLAQHPEPMSAAGLSRELGLPRSTTYRLLTTLAERGFVAHLHESGRYGLGVAAYELGSAYQRQGPLQRAARPVLSRLVEQTTHNAQLAVMHGRDVLYVLEERAQGRPSLITDVGVRLPAEVTATGLAMLSRLSPKQRRAIYPSGVALVQRNGRGPGRWGELRTLLAEAAGRGYAIEAETVTEGLSSIAVAVVDHTGHPVAGVAVTYPARADDPVRAELVVPVQRAAAAISARISG